MRWVWPLPKLGTVPPTVSDGFNLDPSDGHRIHKGVDLMYRGPLAKALSMPFADPLHVYYVPSGTRALAAADGIVSRVSQDAHGHFVELDHAADSGGILPSSPWRTVYRHLQNTRVIQGQRVSAGTPLGAVGQDPTDPSAPAHLHFEMWSLADLSAPLNPEPYLSRAAVLGTAGGGLLLLGLGVLGWQWLAKRKRA